VQDLQPQQLQLPLKHLRKSLRKRKKMKRTLWEVDLVLEMTNGR
jgi:hypothetical protein